jgi:hypothetical protein
MPTSARLRRTLLVGLTVAACTNPPTVAPTPSFAVQASPAPSASPSASPTFSPEPTLAPIGAHWDAVDGIGSGSVYDVAHGEQGWVAVGSSCRDDCPGMDGAVWFSVDGLSWSGGPIHGGVGDADPTANTTLTTVATDGSVWYAAGVRFIFDPVANAGNTWAVSWRSNDARTWSPAGALELGHCYEGCPSIGQLAVVSGGAILSYVVKTLDAARSSVYRTPDGSAWTLVKRSAFGLSQDAPILFDNSATVANDRYVLVGAGCNDCGTVWSSADGRTWTRDGTLGTGPVGFDVASDGRRVVVAEQVCPEEECVTMMWASADGRTGWRAADQTLPIQRPRVAFAAATFIVVGDTGSAGGRVFTSRDGRAWTQVADDLVLGDCALSGLAGAENGLALAAEGCPSLWVSRAASG